MPLSDTAIRNAKLGTTPYKLYDGDGLFLLLNPSGSRLWRLKYQSNGREKLIGPGRYPEVSLKAARDRRDEARRLLATSVDPAEKRKAERLSLPDTFEAIARELLALKSKSLNARTFALKTARLDSFIFPRIGAQSITKVTAVQLLSALRAIEERGLHETAHRVRAQCSEVLRYAVSTGRAQHDVAADLRGALAPVNVRNRPAIVEPSKIGELMRAIHGYHGQPSTEYALKLVLLVFVRPSELRCAEWVEFDFKSALWRVPGRRMKMKDPHVVPLARQSLELLDQLKLVTGRGRHLFPSLTSEERPISDNTLNAALRRLGYSGDEMVAHGFRAMASTCLNEQGWAPDVIELQLAHVERNDVRAAYNRAQRLVERSKMMQSWADYLDSLRTSDPVHHP